MGTLWILFSDTLVAQFIRDPEAMRKISIVKGWFFIFVTAGLLYALIARHLGQILQKEEALELSDRRFKEALESARHLMYRLNVKEGRYDYLSPSVEAVTGYGIEEFAGNGMEESVARFHPDDRPGVKARLDEAVRQWKGEPKTSMTLEYRFLRKDGRYAWFEDWTTVFFDKDGAFDAFVGTVYDITERKEREEQLRQAQKMESIGRLAGGIAHDFNNLLTVILGECSLALRRTPGDSPIQGRLEGIRDASQRAATLTQQLLAFSRKQLLMPKVIDPNQSVRGVDLILRRVLGENIELETALSPGIWNVEADLGQLEQVVVNLAVNARDAMPGGGLLRIETANVESADPIAMGDEEPLPPGRYVSLSVTDTGCGMPEEVRRKAFEPFFTTKEVGKGTGLGLSMVYGIVAQSRGRVAIESAPGEGTTVRIFLPRVDGPAETGERAERGRPEKGAGAIVVVEDEEPVRRLMVRILEEHGYRVAEASDGIEGLRLLESGSQPCDLLVADLVMPRMGGIELAARVRLLRPGLRVMFVSGYSETPPPGADGGISGAAFIQKPFEPDAFVGKAQQVI
ncbi:MAG TPA: ATP-binding protein, partial [Candidatus Deferrimicrobiaceae bacterium]